MIESFNQVVERMIDKTQVSDAPEMVEKIFPKLSVYNRNKWRRAFTAQAGDLFAVRVMERTRFNASKELSSRMGENSTRITAWSREHYQNFQNNFNAAVRRAENTGQSISLREIAQKAIDEGTVPPNTKIKNRAKVIARDQTSKFNSALTRGRARDLGSDFYEWISSHDARVRSKHAAFNGHYFNLRGKEVDRYGNLVSGGLDTGGVQPGDEVMCRCFARWIIVV